LNFWQEKPLQKRQEDAMTHLGDRITVYKVKYKDFELMDHLLINHKILTSYLIMPHVYLITERLT